MYKPPRRNGIYSRKSEMRDEELRSRPLRSGYTGAVAQPRRWGREQERNSHVRGMGTRKHLVCGGQRESNRARGVGGRMYDSSGEEAASTGQENG